MGVDSSSRTSASLLGRLSICPADQAAWAEFVERYGGEIYTWCRRWKLQDADARDVTQAVLAKLAVKMRTFNYDPSLSFRGWLRTLTQHAWSDFVSTWKRPPLGTGDSEVWNRLEGVQARDDLLARLESEFDQELLAEAAARVRLRVEPRTWEAFRLTAIESLSGSAVAERLDMKVATVFRARSIVQKMVRDEIRKLEHP
jgi:RNA polymerase sigma factor (sigma-70 family)